MVSAGHTSLKEIPLFADLSEAELNFLLDRAVALNYQPGQTIFVEGDPCEGLYVIQAGHVKIFKSSPSGREQILTMKGPAGLSPSCRFSTAVIIRRLRRPFLNPLCFSSARRTFSHSSSSIRRWA
ncbi:MAG TPA: cyclic nucleotide-binding domain-containing protein, partial [Terriglobia bacterium]|nr:cyclic nucleotide-binding domain-containing protein [Terriglobia bacterium]